MLDVKLRLLQLLYSTPKVLIFLKACTAIVIKFYSLSNRKFLKLNTNYGYEELHV
jgi:hypothetical protein